LGAKLNLWFYGGYCLLEMLGEAAAESDGLTFRILQTHGPHLSCGRVPREDSDKHRPGINEPRINFDKISARGKAIDSVLRS